MNQIKSIFESINQFKGIKSPIGILQENNLDRDIAHLIYFDSNNIPTIDNKEAPTKNWDNIPNNPSYDFENESPIIPIETYLKKTDENTYIPIEYCKLPNSLDKEYPKDNWESKDGNIWDIIGKDINSQENDFWDNCKKKDLKALSKAFSMGYIDFENEFDFRIQIITDFINKIRQGIKSKIVCKKNAFKLTKSKGYKSHHYTKNLETAKIAIQEAYLYCLSKKKELTLWICILSAQKVMKLDKKHSKKLDFLLWNMRKNLSVESYIDDKSRVESYAKEVTHNYLEDKLNDLKYKLFNFEPKIKLEQKWQKVMTLLICENKSRNELAILFGVTKRRINQIVQFIPDSFKEYENELKSYALKYYKK